MIKVMVGNGQGIETKNYGCLADFRFALQMIKRDNRYLFVVAKTERGPFYGALRGVAGAWAARKWGQGGHIAKLGLTGGDGVFCGICKVRVVPMMDLCPYCEMPLTSAGHGV